MAKIPNRGMTLPSGLLLNHGQLIGPAGLNIDPRRGAAKNFKIANRETGIEGVADYPTDELAVPVHHGHRSRIAPGDMAHAGAPKHSGAVPVHDHMRNTIGERGTDRGPGEAFAVLQEAALNKTTPLDPVEVKPGMSTAAQRAKPRGSGQ